MIVHELTRAECVDVLLRTDVARLACAQHSQPYIVPISFYFDADDSCLYSFSTMGQKIHWMRDNPNVCVEVDEVVDRFNWLTVILNGVYQELPDGTDAARVQARAMSLFQMRSEWWFPGAARLASGSEHDIAVVYRIRIATITGRRAARLPSTI